MDRPLDRDRVVSDASPNRLPRWFVVLLATAPIVVIINQDDQLLPLRPQRLTLELPLAASPAHHTGNGSGTKEQAPPSPQGEGYRLDNTTTTHHHNCRSIF